MPQAKEITKGVVEENMKKQRWNFKGKAKEKDEEEKDKQEEDMGNRRDNTSKTAGK